MIFTLCEAVADEDQSRDWPVHVQIEYLDHASAVDMM